MEKLKEEGFRKMLKNQFVKYNDACIQAFVRGDRGPLFTNLKKLSALVLDNFDPMIPNGFHNLWKEGLETEEYFLKLCGSGGGGFVMGFTRDYESIKEKFQGYAPEVVYRF
jgi:mevalonate kinase